MIRVKATREGLIGAKTATGYVITKSSMFVALPCTRVMKLHVRIRNCLNGIMLEHIPVLDVGPWNERDTNYVICGERPAAECGIDTRGRTTNGAGIDLSEGVWQALQMCDNTDVEWEFMPDPICNPGVS